MSGKTVWISFWVFCLSLCALVVWAAGTWTAGDTVPGNVLSPAYGSRGDVKAAGSFAAGEWTVLMSRRLTTILPTQDVQFDLSDPGNLYPFSVAVFDNSGGNPTTMFPQDTSSYSLGNAGSTADLKAVLVASPPQSVADFPGSPLVTSPLVPLDVAQASLYAAYDAKNIYILAKWTDMGGEASLAKSQWTFDGTDWSQSGNEDRIAILFNINASDWAGCSSFCHVGEEPGEGGRMRTNFPGQTVDMWHWKSARSNPMRVADDKHFIYDAPDGGMKTRKGDDGNAVDSSNKELLAPKYMAENDPGANATFLINMPPGAARAVPFELDTDDEGDDEGGPV